MSETTPEALDALIKTMLGQLGITPEEAWMPGIRGNLQTLLAVAKLVDEFPLPDEIEPAPVYEA